MTAVNIDVTKTELLNVWHRVDHLLQRLHQDDLIESNLAQPKPHKPSCALRQGLK